MLIRHNYYESDTIEEFKGACVDHFGNTDDIGWVVCAIKNTPDYDVLELTDRMTKAEAEEIFEKALSYLPKVGYVYIINPSKKEEPTV